MLVILPVIITEVGFLLGLTTILRSLGAAFQIERLPSRMNREYNVRVELEKMLVQSIASIINIRI